MMTGTPRESPGDDRYHPVAQAFAIAIGIGAAGVLLGWFLRVPVTMWAAGGRPPMGPITALCMIAASASLWLAARKSHKGRAAAHVLSGCVALVATLTLIEYEFGGDFGIARFVNVLRASQDESVGRIPFESSVAFILFAAGLHASQISSWRYVYVTACALGLIQSYLVLVGFVLGADTVHLLYPFNHNFQQAAQAMVSFLTLFVGLSALHPNSSGLAMIGSLSSGGLLSPRVLPWIFVVVPLIGWLRLQGERAGYYGLEEGVAYFLVANITLMTVLIIYTSRKTQALRAAETDMANRATAATAHSQRTDERFRRMFDASPLPMGLVDTGSGVVAAINTQFKKTFGYGDNETVKLEDWWNSAYPDPAYRAEAIANWRAYMTRVSAGEDAAPGEYTITLKNGETRQMLVAGITLPEGMLATFTDITQLRRTELAARNAEIASREKIEAAKADIEAALGAMSDAVFMTDAQGYLTRHNAAFMAFFRCAGEPTAARVSANFYAEFEVYSADGESVTPEMLPTARALRGETQTSVNYTFTLRESGENFIGSVSFAPVRNRDGAINGAVVSIRDVTERVRAVKEMIEQRERLRLLIEHAPVAMALFDRDMRYLAVSKRYLANNGLGNVDLVGRLYYDVFPYLSERWKQVHRRGLAGETLEQAEEAFTRSNGTECWLRWQVLPWRDANGQVAGILLWSEDITDRKHAAAKLRETETQLLQSQKLAAVGQLTGGIAHDFNNLLAVISGNLELMTSEPPLPARALQVFIDRADQAAKSSAKLVRQLLAFSRRQALRPENIDLNMFVENVAELLRRTLGEDVKFVTRLATDVDGVTVDISQLEAALLNLAVNARDAMPHGGTFTLATERVGIESGDAERIGLLPGIYEVVTVTDTGTGMSAETAARAFEPFFTTKDEGRGSGLGLSMVYVT